MRQGCLVFADGIFVAALHTGNLPANGVEAIIVGVMRLCAFEKCFCVIKLTDVG